MEAMSLLRIDANRRNAARSTGPRTILGKARTCLNAFRHGLAAMPGESSAEVILLSKAISTVNPSPICMEYATTIAECTLMLRRVRAIRLEIIEMGVLGQSATRLERLGRYERRALSKRKRAVRALAEVAERAFDRG